MNSKHFEDVLGAQIKRIQDVLSAKADEYADEVDRLANFKKAAHLRGCHTHQAIGGMMVKHTVSVFDMIESGIEYPMEMWDEKITDHLNYLILLRAALVEDEMSQPELSDFQHASSGD